MSMIFWILAGVEALLQMGIGIGLYAKCSGEVHKGNRWRDGALLACLVFLGVLECYTNRHSMVSTSVAPLELLMETVWLRLWFGGNIRKAFCWSFFSKWIMVMMKTPALLITGLCREGDLGVVNNEPTLSGVLLKCVSLILLLAVCLYWREPVTEALRVMLQKRKYVFLLFGLGEMSLALYLMNLVYDFFQPSALVLSLTFIVCLYLLLFILLLWMQYRMAEKENRLYLSREKLLRSDYEMLRGEMDRNRKISHDHKYDLTYLIECLEKGEKEKGITYIEKRLKTGWNRQKSEGWTGCGCVDFLIGNGKERAAREEISFEIEVDITKLPIAEYEFFAILGNLLDNAFEAAQQCPAAERFVKLKLCTMNGMFMLILENSYRTEPKEKKGRFLSTKEEGGGHGWGLENVKEMVEKNEGVIKLEYGNYIFRVQLMFGI